MLHGNEKSVSVAQSSFYRGYFGRMFRLAPHELAPDESMRLAGKLHTNPREENASLPAGYTYLGQFITHDMTFDPASHGQRSGDPDRINNFRSPYIDLDSVYGGGPRVQPELYDAHGRSPFHFRIGNSCPLGARNRAVDDLPRLQVRLCNVITGNWFHAANGEIERADKSQLTRWLGRTWARVHGMSAVRNEDGDLVEAAANSIWHAGQNPVIGDPRNDENIILSQLHLALLKFHNHVLDHVTRDRNSGPSAKCFAEARRIVTWHYQWVVLHDLLPRLVGSELVEELLQRARAGKSLRHYRWRTSPFMPVEFAAAAFRFGHTLVRDSYRLNQQLRDIPVFSPRAGGDIGELEDLRGGRSLPADWQIHWPLFFDFADGTQPQKAMAIGPALSQNLTRLPDRDPRFLALRTLEKGVQLGLPSGNAIAKAMGEEPVLEQDVPLWYYILEEARHASGAAQLGPVASRIVAETIIGATAADPSGFLRSAPRWRPTLGEGEEFQMADLLRVAGFEAPDFCRPRSSPTAVQGEELQE